jgi:hypothetical protein
MIIPRKRSDRRTFDPAVQYPIIPTTSVQSATYFAVSSATTNSLNAVSTMAATDGIE